MILPVDEIRIDTDWDAGPGQMCQGAVRSPVKQGRVVPGVYVSDIPASRVELAVKHGHE